MARYDWETPRRAAASTWPRAFVSRAERRSRPFMAPPMLSQRCDSTWDDEIRERGSHAGGLVTAHPRALTSVERDDRRARPASHLRLRHRRQGRGLSRRDARLRGREGKLHAPPEAT